MLNVWGGRKTPDPGIEPASFQNFRKAIAEAGKRMKTDQKLMNANSTHVDLLHSWKLHYN